MWAKHETHKVVSVTATWLVLPGLSSDSTTAELTLSCRCLCGKEQVYIWTFAAGLGDDFQELMSGLMLSADLAGGRLANH